MASAAIKRYWDWLSVAHSSCVCGAMAQSLHHIIHVNRQRITKDDMLVVGLCAECHQNGDQSVHKLGGERQFLNETGWNLVEIAALRRHNWEVRGA